MAGCGAAKEQLTAAITGRAIQTIRQCPKLLTENITTALIISGLKYRQNLI
jgi:hypothetical protein